MQNLVSLFLKIPRTSESGPEATQTFLATLTQIAAVSPLQKLFGAKSQTLSLEIVLTNQQIKFFIICDAELATFVESQLQSNYPLIVVERTDDPLSGIDQTNLQTTSLVLRRGNYYPLAPFSSFPEIDPISSVLSVLSRSEPDQFTLIQICLEAVGSSWQKVGQKFAETGGGKKEDGSYAKHPDEALIKEKISFPGFKASIRFVSNKKTTLSELTNTFAVFARADANGFAQKKKPLLAGKKIMRNILTRQVSDSQILTISELATMWHLPTIKIKIPSIVWGISVLSEPPDNLPISLDQTDEQKQDINFFAKAQFKNREQIFGIKHNDRRRHMWILGKSGTGKSTLIANMAIDDLKKGRGIGIIDPHGDLCETLLEYIPSDRINDTIYFNPADREYPIVINPLEVSNRAEAELVVSGLMAVFTKIWANVWSARMEYILRNSFLTLAILPDATLEKVLTLLTNDSYRSQVIQQIDDQVLKNYWINEFNKMQDRQREEAISSILNKIGQFVTSPLIRRIISQPKSSIKIDQAMNEGKIILANLSQGRLGEDNSALLGATLITKFQLAAMHRVDIKEEERKDFFLFVDEFQNFATPSFMKILSEARKYRLGLTLANQYMAQIPEEVQKAILGNAGTIITFACGAEDAQVIHKEFAEVFSENDLVNLASRHIGVKLMVDGHASRPFVAQTLPLPTSTNTHKDKVLEVSRERWAQKYVEPPPPLINVESKPQQSRPQYQNQRPYQPRPQQGQSSGYQNRPRPQYQPNNNQGGPRPPQQPIRDTARENKPLDQAVATQVPQPAADLQKTNS